MFSTQLDLFDSPTADEPVLRITRPERVALSWSDFDAPGPNARARITLVAHPELRFSGFGALDTSRFQLRSRIDVVRHHVWMRKGSDVIVRGRTDGGLAVESEGFTTVARCADVAYTPSRIPNDPSDAPPPGRAEAIPTGKVVHLFDRPGGRAVAALQPNRLKLAWIGSVDGFAHVSSDGDVALLGWAPLSEVDRVIGEMLDRDSSCGVPDDYDECEAKAHIVRDVPIFVGERVEREGNIVRGLATSIVLIKDSPVYVHGRQGDLVAVAVPGHSIEAPPGRELWVPESALSKVPSTTARVEDDGCPDDATW